MVVTKLPLSHQTMFADLGSRCLDAAFDEQFSENGSFVKKDVRGRSHWYYSQYCKSPTGGPGERKKLYVGPVSDPAITSRVERFTDIKVNYRERRQMVQSLTAAGLPSPPGFVGDIVEGLWKAGLFRLNGLLVGSLAFQAYSGFLGVTMPGAAMATVDADFAQFHSISSLVDDTMPSMDEVLKSIDPTFRAVPHLGSPTLSTKYRNARDYEVEFLTPNRGSDDHQGKPTKMAALGGVGAEPLRFLDFLLHSPVRSVLLHKGGIPVNVPAPERYAVHKLIVSTRRRTDDKGRRKSEKDRLQSWLLLEALARESRLTDAGFAWMEAWDRGLHWQTALSEGLAASGPAARAMMAEAVLEGCALDRKNPADYGFHPPADEDDQTLADAPRARGG